MFFPIIFPKQEYAPVVISYDGQGVLGYTATATFSAASANDLILAMWAGNGASTAPGNPSGYTSLGVVGNGSGSAGSQCKMWYKKADGGETSVSISLGVAAAHVIIAIVIRNVDWRSGIVPEAASASNASSGTLDTPNVTQSWGYDKTLYISCGARRTTEPSTFPTNYINPLYTTYSGTSIGSGTTYATAAWYLTDATSNNPGSFADGGNDSWAGFTVAVKGAHQ